MSDPTATALMKMTLDAFAAQRAVLRIDTDAAPVWLCPDAATREELVAGARPRTRLGVDGDRDGAGE